MTTDPAVTLARLDAKIGELSARRRAIAGECANLLRELLAVDERLAELMVETGRVVERSGL